MLISKFVPQLYKHSELPMKPFQRSKSIAHLLHMLPFIPAKHFHAIPGVRLPTTSPNRLRMYKSSIMMFERFLNHIGFSLSSLFFLDKLLQQHLVVRDQSFSSSCLSLSVSLSFYNACFFSWSHHWFSCSEEFLAVTDPISWKLAICPRSNLEPWYNPVSLQIFQRFQLSSTSPWSFQNLHVNYLCIPRGLFPDHQAPAN